MPDIDSMLIFLPTLLPENTKQKVYDQIRDKYLKENVWELQYSFYSKLKDIEMSGILGCNDVIDPILLQEYRDCDNIANKLDRVWDKWKSLISNTPDYNFKSICLEKYQEAMSNIKHFK